MEQSIIEGNIAIDIFYSGRELYSSGEFMGRKRGFPKQHENWYDVTNVDELKYHSSWDALMPVFIKIGTMWRWQIEKFGCTIYAPIKIEFGFVKEDSNSENASKHCCWLAVIEFLNWYNQTHPQQLKK